LAGNPAEKMNAVRLAGSGRKHQFSGLW